jgi:hypothetical protein
MLSLEHPAQETLSAVMYATYTACYTTHTDTTMSSDEADDTNSQSSRSSLEVTDKDDVGTTSLRFVTVTAKSLTQHRSELNTDEARHVRSHVMKDYLRRQHDTPKRRSSPNISTLSDHIGRFRFSPNPARKGTRQSSETSRRRKPSSKVRPAIRMLVPKDLRILEDSFALPLPIDQSTPGTMTLLEYYHTSFWANSLAVNPEGKWMSVAISDPAILHATLCLVALHKFQTKRVPLANSYFFHRGEAMRLITTHLDEPANATSDNNIGAIAVLSTSDNTLAWPPAIQESHMSGLLTLVNLRGGIDGMSSNKHIKRVVAWADVLHATTHNTMPQLGTAKCTTDRDTKPLLNLVKRHGFSVLNLNAASDDIIPKSMQEIFQNLRLLAKAKSLLLHARSDDSAAELRPIFSSLLFKTERRILELGQGVLLTDAYIFEGHEDGLETLFCAEAIKSACLIFTYHGLRDLHITAAFFGKLVGRLRDALENVLDHHRHVGARSEAVENEAPEETLLRELGLPVKHLTFLLWLMLNGWKGSGLEEQREDREWFVEAAASICSISHITSAAALGTRMQRVLFLPEYCLDAVNGLWEDIEGARRLRTTES